MYSLGIKTLFVSLMLVSQFSFAEEPGGGAEKKEGEAAAGGEAAAPKERRTSEASYAEVQAKVSGLEAKIRSGEEEIAKLIAEKQHTTNPERTSQIVSEMVRLHREMQTNARDYDQQRSLLKYRYPEKGIGGEKREYERIEVKSLDEMEDSLSLSSSVNKTLKKVRTQYEKPDMPVKSEKKTSKKTKEKTEEPALTAPVILKK
ncbi:hypothetical protein D3C87_947670 [compost metagenome]